VNFRVQIYTELKYSFTGKKSFSVNIPLSKAQRGRDRNNALKGFLMLLLERLLLSPTIFRVIYIKLRV